MHTSSVLHPKSLLLVGAGKMGGALLQAWIEGGIDKASVVVLDKIVSPLFKTVQSLEDVKTAPECIVLAVKPQSLDEVLPDLKKKFGDTPFYISIAAGKTIAYFEKHIGSTAAIIRAMPNTPALIGKGISVLCANKKADEKHKNMAAALLIAAGDILWLEDESLMNAVTAISGSGPAYVFLFLEALIAAGKSQGLPEDMCRQLAIETLLGSAALAKISHEPLETLRVNVTSKGGTTEAALAVLMKDDGLKSLFSKAVSSAVKRGGELAE